MSNRSASQMMNQAIDQSIDADERKALRAHLENTPEDANTFSRLQQVDRMLRAAPLIDAPAGFADRVMALIGKTHKNNIDRRRGGSGFALGLWLATLLTLPILSGMVYIGLRAFTGPTAGQFLGSIHAAWLHLTNTWQNSGFQKTVNTPLFQIGAAALIPLTGGIAWFTRFITSTGNAVTYRIPVKIIS